METPIDPIVIIAAIALGVFLLLLFVISVVLRLERFLEELRYVNMEIQRASPRERKFWLRRRRRLWLMLLPFGE